MALQMKPLLRRDGGGSPPTRIYGENTTTAFSVGGFVKMADGKVQGLNSGTQTVYSNGAITTTTIASNFVGVALAGSTDVDATDIPVSLAFPDVEFGLPVLHATAASAIAAKNLIGDTYELVQYTNSDGRVIIGVAIDRTSSPVFVVTDVPDGEVGQLNGIVWGKIISGEREPGMI
jgi:hypothetical protein